MRQINQCDGCRRGLPVNDHGIHRAAGYDLMACTAHLYQPPAQQPEIRAVFRCGPSGKPGDDWIGQMDAPLWGPPEVEDDGTITVPIDHWPAPAQQPMTEDQIMREIPGIGWDYLVDDVLPTVRAVEAFHGIGKEV